MIPQYIKTPYTAEQLRASGSRISSNNHTNGTWRINGKNAMDKHGRIFLSFIKNSTYRELNYLRGLLLRGRTHSDGTPLRTGFEKLNRPFRMDKAGAFNPNNEDDAFLSLAKKGEVWALQRLMTRTDIVSPTRKIALMSKAEEVKRARDAKATYGNANQAAAESTNKDGSKTHKFVKLDLKARADLAERHGVPKRLFYKDIDSLKLAGRLPNGSFSVMLKLKDFRQIHLTGFTFEFAKRLVTDYQNWLKGKAGCGLIEREVVGGAGGTSPGSPTGQSPSATRQLVELAVKAQPLDNEKCQTRHAQPASDIQFDGSLTLLERHKLFEQAWREENPNAPEPTEHEWGVLKKEFDAMPLVDQYQFLNVMPTAPYKSQLRTMSPVESKRLLHGNWRKPSFMERAGKWLVGLIR